MSNNSVYVNAGPATVTVGDGLTGDGSGGNPLVVQVDGTTIETTAGAMNVVDPLVLTTFQGAFKSSDGTAGASAGPFTTVASIRVKNGLVTTLTGS